MLDMDAISSEDEARTTREEEDEEGQLEQVAEPELEEQDTSPAGETVPPTPHPKRTPSSYTHHIFCIEYRHTKGFQQWTRRQRLQIVEIHRICCLW